MRSSRASAYAALPGTVAFRALAHLESLSSGAELSGAQLAEAIGVPPNNLAPSMDAAVRAGMVFRRQKDRAHQRSPIFWSLVDHAGSSPPSPPALPALARRRPDGGVTVASAEVVALAQPADDPRLREYVDAIDARHPKDAEKSEGAAELRIALWSDGTLQIQRGPLSELMLSVEETRALLHYLDRMSDREELVS